MSAQSAADCEITCSQIKWPPGITVRFCSEPVAGVGGGSHLSEGLNYLALESKTIHKNTISVFENSFSVVEGSSILNS